MDDLVKTDGASIGKLCLNSVVSHPNCLKLNLRTFKGSKIAFDGTKMALCGNPDLKIRSEYTHPSRQFLSADTSVLGE